MNPGPPPSASLCSSLCLRLREVATSWKSHQGHDLCDAGCPGHRKTLQSPLGFWSTLLRGQVQTTCRQATGLSSRLAKVILARSDRPGLRPRGMLRKMFPLATRENWHSGKERRLGRKADSNPSLSLLDIPPPPRSLHTSLGLLLPWQNG